MLEMKWGGEGGRGEGNLQVDRCVPLDVDVVWGWMQWSSSYRGRLGAWGRGAGGRELIGGEVCPTRC